MLMMIILTKTIMMRMARISIKDKYNDGDSNVDDDNDAEDDDTCFTLFWGSLYI
mgnify:CR=1 FL=1